MMRGRNQLIPESGDNDRSRKTVRNRETEVPTRRSQASARLIPAPAATPLTAAIVGFVQPYTASA